MALYKSADYPFSIQYPADWTREPSDPDVTVSFAGPKNAYLGIAELDLESEGFGELSLKSFADMLLLGMEIEGFALVSREERLTPQGQPFETIELSAVGGAVMGSVALYLHDGRMGVQVFYVGPNARYEELKPLIEYTFETFNVEETTAITQQEKTLMQYDAPPPMTIDEDKRYTATIHMEKGGEITIELFPKEAPVTVNSFVFLAREGYYDGVTFHRVIAGFMAQGGDPTGTGTGGTWVQVRQRAEPGQAPRYAGGVVDGQRRNPERERDKRQPVLYHLRADAVPRWL